MYGKVCTSPLPLPNSSRRRGRRLTGHRSKSLERVRLSYWAATGFISLPLHCWKKEDTDDRVSRWHSPIDSCCLLGSWCRPPEIQPGKLNFGRSPIQGVIAAIGGHAGWSVARRARVARVATDGAGWGTCVRQRMICLLKAGTHVIPGQRSLVSAHYLNSAKEILYWLGAIYEYFAVQFLSIPTSSSMLCGLHHNGNTEQSRVSP